MNISNINVRITEKDLLSIIEDNLKIKELNINNIEIGELIKVRGVYKKGINIKFEAILGLGSIKDNVLKLRIFKLKVGIFPIWTSLVNIIVKNILKNFKDIGITLEKKLIFIDFNILCNYIPSVDFVLKHITLFKNSAEVYVENLVYKDDKEVLSLSDLKDKISNEKNEDINNDEAVTKQEDGYFKIREDVKCKFSKEYDAIGEYILLIPDIMVLLYRLMKDYRIDKKLKVSIGSLIAYLALPVDIIPDSIPILGKIDDFGIGFMLLDKIIDNIPEKIILEHWQGRVNIITKVKEVKGILFDSLGRKNTLMALNGCIVGLKKLIRKKEKKVMK
ncbi:YkvA family protein [Clostridium botulinum]|uniref:DUF1232 domain-containing protein n=2 Tax=Clostridium botulinum TaxID=1491 RepID=A0A9Q1ZCT5_CLOBO|nr:DUF1232 domain-containing protein [Clostridium botulinum]KEI01175.1 hypothetical protein Y848_09740 [Clostridium botulinum C/D str. Sp77]KLU76389.1 hypothetical protein CBC3_04080 [Clostridium botulinum V891]KOA73180.1 hypothetical protein ADU78_13170 [Clostridium botulinum]KOA79692.1 hypothetical protein ADU77_03680 [Clostridium botulinum]KOA85978.1 hypothetical protein ADU80_06050 [Clostridium botulinum]